MMDGSLKHDDIHRTGSKQRIATPPEEDRAATVVTLHRKFGEDRTCGFYDMTDRQTDTLVTKLRSPILTQHDQTVLRIFGADKRQKRHPAVIKKGKVCYSPRGV